MNPVEGKVIIVTGGANGIGLAYVKELLANGAKGVAIVDINKEAGTAVVAKFAEEYGRGKIIYINADVSKESELEDAFKETVATFKQFDILINNAGTLNEVNWERTLAINVASAIRGTILAAEKYLPQYKSGSEGVVINTSSISAFTPLAIGPVYSATKCAVIGFSRSYGTPQHYAKFPVRVMTICPGATFTDLSLSLSSDTVGWYVDIAGEYFSDYSFQETEDVAKALLVILQQGKNGSVWVVEGRNAPYAADIELRAKL